MPKFLFHYLKYWYTFRILVGGKMFRIQKYESIHISFLDRFLPESKPDPSELHNFLATSILARDAAISTISNLCIFPSVALKIQYLSFHASQQFTIASILQYFCTAYVEQSKDFVSLLVGCMMYVFFHHCWDFASSTKESDLFALYQYENKPPKNLIFVLMSPPPIFPYKI